MAEQKVIYGHNTVVLKTHADNSIDAIVTDAPYGLGKEPKAEAVMRDWIEKGYHEVTGSGFMGKKWDSFVPQPAFWKEAFRVLKPGGYVICFFGARTYDWGVMAMRFAGFRICDSIHWIYSSGFPKNMNVPNAIDKQLGHKPTVVGERRLWGENASGGRADQNSNDYQESIDGAEKFVPITTASSDEAKRYQAYGTALKPGHEPIVLAQKPIEKGLNIAQNILKWGTGALNIDGCRVGFQDQEDFEESVLKNQHADFGTAPLEGNNTYGDYSMVERRNYMPPGRWPANLIFTHLPGCKLIGTKKVRGTLCPKPSDSKAGGDGTADYFSPIQGNRGPRGYGDENNDETIEDWECEEGCAIRKMDQQSGIEPLARGSGNARTNKGGASRFFLNTSFSEHDVSLFRYQPKASGRERNFGLDDNQRNNHPTLKPVSVMQYLVRLVAPPGATILDPYNGSGTTGIACKLEGFDYIGIDHEENNVEISRIRISQWSIANNPLDANGRLKNMTLAASIEKESNQLDLFHEEEQQ